MPAPNGPEEQDDCTNEEVNKQPKKLQDEVDKGMNIKKNKEFLAPFLEDIQEAMGVEKPEKPEKPEKKKARKHMTKKEKGKVEVENEDIGNKRWSGPMWI